jgi:hypothetical protein
MKNRKNCHSPQLSNALSVGLIFILMIFTLNACKDKNNAKTTFTLEDIFLHVPLTLASVSQSYRSDVSAAGLNDMEEPLLCVSTKISEKSNTYFIQPDQVELKDIKFKYHDAFVIDMKTALLFRDNESGKETLIYLKGRFPIDSLTNQPDVIIPVLGITRYHSQLERISSRWTEIVCKCTDKSSGPVIYKDRTIDQCDSGGNGINQCSLTTEGALMSCQTECRAGAVACCWFEF